MSLQDKASIIWNQGAPSKAGFVAAWNPQAQALVNFSVTRSTTKTRVNEAGLIESVAANVLPRDFTDGGCGDFMIEPESQQYLQETDGTWAVNSGTPVVTLDAQTFRGQNVYKVEFPNAASTIQSVQKICNTLRGDFTNSVYIKASVSSDILLGQSTNLALATVQSITTEWTQIQSTKTLSGSSRLRISRVNGITNTDAITVYLSIPQVETNSYPTSYIPNSGTGIVTRNADVPALTGASALLGDSAGALFVEAAVFETSTSKRISLSDGRTTNRILLGLAAKSSLLASNAAGTQADIGGSTLTANVFFKVLIRYANNDFAIHQGGSEIGTDTSGTTFTDGLLNTIRLASGTGSSAQFYGRIRQLVVFNQSPTSAQANSITTP